MKQYILYYRYMRLEAVFIRDINNILDHLVILGTIPIYLHTFR